MKCQKCGAKIPDGKIYCEQCGAAIQMVPDYNPAEDISIGTEEQEDQKDQTVRPEEPVHEDKTEKKRILKKRYIAAGAVLLLLGVLGYQTAYRSIVGTLEADSGEEVIVLLEKPKFNIESGEYKYLPRLTISHPEQDSGSIYYTTDGTTPDLNSQIYTKPIEIGEGRTIIRAIFIRDDGTQSVEADGTYDVALRYPDEPVFSVAGGTYVGEFQVSIHADENCKIYYTTNGEEPGYHSRLYQWPITIPVGHTVLQAVSVDEDGGMSGITEAIYNVQEITDDISVETLTPEG